MKPRRRYWAVRMLLFLSLWAPLLSWAGTSVLDPVPVAGNSGQGQVEGIIGPVELNPIFDYIHRGEPVGAKEFLAIFGETFEGHIFTDSRLNDLLALAAKREEDSRQLLWMDVLPVFGTGDERVEALLAALEQDASRSKPRLPGLLRLAGGQNPLDAHKMLELLGENRDPRVARLLTLIQDKGTLSLEEVLELFAYGDRHRSAVISLIDKNRPLDLSRIVLWAGLKNPEAVPIIQTLSAGGLLSLSQTRTLIAGSLHPKTVALVYLTGHRNATVSIYDIIGGGYAFLLKEQYRKEIAQTLKSSESLSQIFKRQSSVPLSSLISDSEGKFFRLSSMLNKKGKNLLKGLQARSKSVNTLLADKGEYALEEILSDTLPALVFHGRLPATIHSFYPARSSGSYLTEVGANLGVTGSFRGSFGQIKSQTMAFEILRVANRGNASARNFAFQSLSTTGLFRLIRHTCPKVLEAGNSCEAVLGALGTKGRSSDVLILNFTDDRGAGQMRVPLDVLIVDKISQ